MEEDPTASETSIRGLTHSRSAGFDAGQTHKVVATICGARVMRFKRDVSAMEWGSHF
jgi:hypothetical protein